MNTAFEGFIDARASDHHFAFSSDVAHVIRDDQGNFKDPLATDSELFDQMAYIGQSIMLAALIELRGVTDENTALLERINQSVLPGVTPFEDQVHELGMVTDGLLRTGWQVNGRYETPQDATVSGFITGMGMLGVARNASRFASHPRVGHERFKSTSISGGTHNDHDMTHVVDSLNERENSHSLGKILNTNSGKAVVLSTHSYNGKMDRKLLFSVPTWAGKQHSIASNIGFYITTSRDDGLNISLSTGSHHVDSRRFAVDVFPRRQSADRTLGEINDALQVVL